MKRLVTALIFAAIASTSMVTTAEATTSKAVQDFSIQSASISKTANCAIGSWYYDKDNNALNTAQETVYVSKGLYTLNAFATAGNVRYIVTDSVLKITGKQVTGCASYQLGIVYTEGRVSKTISAPAVTPTIATIKYNVDGTKVTGDFDQNLSASNQAAGVNVPQISLQSTQKLTIRAVTVKTLATDGECQQFFWPASGLPGQVTRPRRIDNTCPA